MACAELGCCAVPLRMLVRESRACSSIILCFMAPRRGGIRPRLAEEPVPVQAITSIVFIGD